MSTTSYSASERGGGSGDTADMRGALLRQINQYFRVSHFADTERADRVHEKLNEAPEKFINPDPAADIEEERSRVWGEIKDEFGLRTKNERDQLVKEYEERAERHYQKKRERDPEPEPTEPVGPTPEKTDVTPDSEPEAIDDPVAAEPEPDPADVDRTPPDRKPPEDMGVVELVVSTFKEMIRREKRKAKAEVRDTPTAEPTTDQPTQKTIQNFA